MDKKFSPLHSQMNSDDVEELRMMLITLDPNHSDRSPWYIPLNVFKSLDMEITHDDLSEFIGGTFLSDLTDEFGYEFIAKITVTGKMGLLSILCGPWDLNSDDTEHMIASWTFIERFNQNPWGYEVECKTLDSPVSRGSVWALTFKVPSRVSQMFFTVVV